MTKEREAYPRWDIERLELIRALSRRAVQLHMREMLRDLHKSPYLLPGQWEQMVETYRMCFPGDPEQGTLNT